VLNVQRTDRNGHKEYTDENQKQQGITNTISRLVKVISSTHFFIYYQSKTLIRKVTARIILSLLLLTDLS
jgi:hypothetical protein